MNEEDKFLEQLISDESTLDHWLQSEEDSSSGFSISDHEEHHVVYVKRRKYEWKNGPTQQAVTIPKRSRRIRGHFAIPIPRILKSDIRRKFVSMYENVMNSYNYHLISSYFQRFFVPDVRFEKKDIFTSPLKSSTILEGVQPVLSFFLLLLQICPDKITRVSEIQLKQSSDDIDRTEVACKFNVTNTAVYQMTVPQFFSIVKNEVKAICDRFIEYRPNEDYQITAISRKRKMDTPPNEGEERHQSLFDPISGMFMKSRFQRLETPMEYEVEGHLSFIVNHEKRIERIIVTATGKKNSVKFP